MSAQEVRSLYRQILRAAAEWPSIKRAAIIQEIRREFRENKSVTAERKAALLRQAHDGLDTLRRQTRARTDSSFSFR